MLYRFDRLCSRLYLTGGDVLVGLPMALLGGLIVRLGMHALFPSLDADLVPVLLFVGTCHLVMCIVFNRRRTKNATWVKRAEGCVHQDEGGTQVTQVTSNREHRCCGEVDENQD